MDIQESCVIDGGIKRMKDVPFVSEEVLVPIPPGALSDVKEVAEHSRKRVIPLISKI